MKKQKSKRLNSTDDTIEVKDNAENVGSNNILDKELTIKEPAASYRVLTRVDRSDKTDKTKNLEAVVLPKDTRSYLAGLFKQVRERAGVTQEEIATKLFETSQRVYQRWESGNSQPSGSAVVILHLFKEHLDKEQEEEDKQKHRIRFDTPFHIAEDIAKRLNGIEDVCFSMKQKGEAVIKSIKSFLSYAYALGLTDTRHKFDKYPILIEWLPNNHFKTMQVYLYFDQRNQTKLVFDAKFVDIDDNTSRLEVLTFYHGQWVSIIQEAVDVFTAHSAMEIDDSSVITDLKIALLPNKN